MSSKPSLWTWPTHFLRQYTAPQREATSLVGKECPVFFWIITWWLYVSRWMIKERGTGQEGKKEWSGKPSTSLKAPYLRNGLLRKDHHNQSLDSHLASNQSEKAQLWDACLKHISRSPTSGTHWAYCCRWLGPTSFPLHTWGLCQAQCSGHHRSVHPLGLPGLVYSLQLVLSWLSS